MQKSWNYIAVVLDEDDRRRLEHAMSGFIRPDWTRCCHHVTLIYNDGSARAEEYRQRLLPLVGSRAALFCRTVALSDDIGAVGVYLPISLPCANKKPHITLGYRRPASPKDSNSITRWLPLEERPGILHGTVTVL